jgi:hypothetical protein
VVSSGNLVIATVAANGSPFDLHGFRGLHPQDSQAMSQDGFHAAHQPEASLGQFDVVRDEAMLRAKRDKRRVENAIIDMKNVFDSIKRLFELGSMNS